MTDDQLIEKYIWLPEGTTWPAEALLKGHWQHIWALIGVIEGTGRGAEGIAEEYGIPLEAAEAAMAYYRRHQGVIDYKLASNNAYFD